MYLITTFILRVYLLQFVERESDIKNTFSDIVTVSYWLIVHTYLKVDTLIVLLPVVCWKLVKFLSVRMDTLNGLEYGMQLNYNAICMCVQSIMKYDQNTIQ